MTIQEYSEGGYLVEILYEVPERMMHHQLKEVAVSFYMTASNPNIVRVIIVYNPPRTAA